MKKIFMAMAVVLLSATMFTSCKSNEPQSDPIDEFVAMGKYVGMEVSGIKADLEKNGWTASTASQTAYSKLINNNKAVFELEATSGTCRSVQAGIYGNYYEDAKSMLNKLGASYTFPLVQVTANFASVVGVKPGGEAEIQPDFAGAQGCVNNNSYTDFVASWAGGSGYVVTILTDSEENATAIVFGQMLE